MDELIFCISIGIITFFIGLAFGYYGLKVYYGKHFIVVANECRDKDSIEPLLNELERET